MSCFICGRSSCTESFHSLEEQELYAPAIDLMERARDLRDKIREEERQRL
jgi:transcription elongation factor Elf1